MASSMIKNMKFSLFVISPLVAILLISATSRLKDNMINISFSAKTFLGFGQIKNTPASNFLLKEFERRKIKIALVNTHEEDEVEWKVHGKTSVIHFDQVPKDRRWEDYFPEWIDEDETLSTPTCKDIPMPIYDKYDEFGVVISRVPCGDNVVDQREGVRDVSRLQVNLVVANLVVNKIRGEDHDPRQVYVVFLGPCEPMWEIFRCEDLVLHKKDFRIYKPDLRRLKQKVLMPTGTCQLALPFEKQGEEQINYNFSKLEDPMDHPRQAYVTVLHSSETYVCGAITLAQSIIQTNTTKDLVLLADKSITEKSRRALQTAGWKIKNIDRIRSPYAKRGAYNEWNYSKLRIWQLSEYDKIIFIDSDVIILKNIDKFFVFPQLSAVGNDKMLFNSGLMSIEPSNCVFKSLMKKRRTLFSYNGGDQGFLNEAFTWWHRLPKRLNRLKFFSPGSNTEHKLPETLLAIHYVGLKPWTCHRDYDCNWDMPDHHYYASNSAHAKWWEAHDTMPKRLQRFCGLSQVSTMLK
ncbi:hypothetical protein GIB67_032390 [Kingdonia uniflora]|uniref:Hexosyltransferase n=1 Tax=Kingdonia uniflora TaxID=39325 RepID=A0A7J7MJ80_9MAGN|nr:hypothetical protein GIB67_032390 [Kingdonia uniflora]